MAADTNSQMYCRETQLQLNKQLQQASTGYLDYPFLIIGVAAPSKSHQTATKPNQTAESHIISHTRDGPFVKQVTIDFH